MAMHLKKVNHPLNETWELRNENYDKEILLATLLQKYDDFGVEQEDPRLFKYYAEIWWRKHYRTFEKWFDAFDIPYSPLINNWRSQQHSIEESSEGNQYNRFKNKDNVTDHHIGDAFSNEDFHNEYEDHKVTNETIDNDGTTHLGRNESTDATSASIKTNAQSDDKTVTNIKDGKNNEAGTENKTQNTLSDITVDVTGAQYNNEHSGGVSGSVTTPGSMNFTPGTDTRKTENTVSAYNSTGYEPSSQDEVKGDMGNSGKNTSTTHTHGTADKNKITEDNSNTKDTKYSELNSGNEQNQMNAEEHNTGANKENVVSTEIGKTTDDTTTDFTDDTNGENTNNKQTTSNDKYINNSNGLHSGDSQMKNDNKKTMVEKEYHEGNVGTMTAQQMLDSELKIQMIDLYDQMAELFVDENCVCIYLNNWQRGGCFCDF